ncbi:hypothetical protein AB0M39_14105 [Streptomyces sp. NPDC051907]|uniref:hypothetical protein n=1 Tax=Streptomyces sp. NPDC051907 TaxID=3155284 RepID=UPI0034367C56
MRAAERDNQIVLSLPPAELLRISAVLTESLALSRTEFFIRTGCSKPNVEELVRLLEDVAEGKAQEFELDVPAGVEADENTRRPRR